jgi:protein tyrosine phosphatase
MTVVRRKKSPPIFIAQDSEEEIQDHFIQRQIRAEKGGETHHMTQFHYTGWPDHNTPSSPDALRCMIESVRDYRKKHDIPMVVHCR